MAFLTVELYIRKWRGCSREFGVPEAVRRSFRELTAMVGSSKSKDHLDIASILGNLAIGAAPRSNNAILRLKELGFSHLVNLRSERKETDVLATTKDLCVYWVPVYDDWKPKPPEFFRQLTSEIRRILSEDDVKLLLCCGAGEHRAPLAGALALVTLGYLLEDAIDVVKKSRPKAEFLSVYESSLIEFLTNGKID